MRKLAAFGLKRIADMDRGELIHVIDSLYTTILAINSRTIGQDRTELPHSDLDQYQAVLEKWFLGDADPVEPVHSAQEPEG